MKKSIVTKKGDRGYSSLMDGKKFLKSKLIFEILGQMDKLSVDCSLALIYLPKKEKSIAIFLKKIQQQLYYLSAFLAGYEKTKESNFLIQIEDEIKTLENKINDDLKHFIFNSWQLETIYLDVLRVNSRSLERLVVRFSLHKSQFHFLLPILNRLSDYFFLAKVYVHQKYKFKVEELS